jgi:hypothetical protein
LLDGSIIEAITALARLKSVAGAAGLIFVDQGVSEWLPKPERGETPIHLRRAKY